MPCEHPWFVEISRSERLRIGTKGYATPHEAALVYSKTVSGMQWSSKLQRYSVIRVKPPKPPTMVEKEIEVECEMDDDMDDDEILFKTHLLYGDHDGHVPIVNDSVQVRTAGVDWMNAVLSRSPPSTPPSAVAALSFVQNTSPSPDAPPPAVDAQSVDADPEPTFPALPMPLPGAHLAAIEKRIMGKSFQHESVPIKRLEQLESHLGIELTNNMSIEKRIIQIENKAIDKLKAKIVEYS